jgi:acetyltransferase-like isoleucine patch superfamily enzyme
MPRVLGQGTVRLGRICLRGSIAPVELGATRGGELTIGDGSYLNQGCSIVSTLRIDIGEGVRIADFVAIYDTDYHPVDQASEIRQAPVVIEDNVWIGRGAIVLPGVRIGTHSVVAAGAVVTTDVPERTLVAGSPARAVRALAAEDGWRRP